MTEQKHPKPTERVLRVWTSVIETLGDMPFFLAIQRGMALTLPLILVGAASLTLRHFPLPAFQLLLDSAVGQGWRILCDDLVDGSFGIASLALLCTFSGTLAAIRNQRQAGPALSPILTATVSLSCFFVLTVPGKNNAWQTLFSLDRGMLLALCVAAGGSGLFLRLSRLRFLRPRLMTVGNDPVIRDVLSGMPAAMLTIVAFGLLRMLLLSLDVVDPRTALDTLLAQPFSKAGDDLGTALGYAGLSQLFWFVGAHGPNVLFAVEDKILIPAGIANATAAIVGQSPAFVFTKAFFDAFTRMGGSGCTLSLILAIMLKSRDGGARKICLLALLPSLFNVNEPLLFGIPLVLNPLYFIPFLLVPMIQTLVAFSATSIGLLPHTLAGMPWTTPVLLSGYTATGSLAGPVIQIVNLALGAALYLPFVHLSDQLRQRQGHRTIDLLLLAANGGGPRPGGRKCLDLVGEGGRAAKALAEDLEWALIHDNQLFLQYQPQVEAETGRVHGVEALLRWRHPIYGQIPPSVAVALAEDTEHIGRLGMFVLNEACAQRAAWRDLAPNDLGISVNVSPRQLLDPFFAQKVMDILRANDLPPRLLELEITESTVLEPNALTLDTLNGLRNSGVRVAIDDFGMGHVSLRYLREFPVDTVKIDRSLTAAAPGAVNEHIVSSIVELSRTLGFLTVVEGVETPEQVERFRTLGCSLFQGYLFSAPVSGEDCLAFFKKRSAARSSSSRQTPLLRPAGHG